MRRAVAAAGLAGGLAVVAAAAYTIAAGRDAAAAMLAGHPDLTAILAGNDMLALGVYEALAAAGLRCPADVSVAGHNDMPLVDRIEPPLTTVAIPRYEIGVAAAQRLPARLGGGGAEGGDPGGPRERRARPRRDGPPV